MVTNFSRQIFLVSRYSFCPKKLTGPDAWFRDVKMLLTEKYRSNEKTQNYLPSMFRILTLSIFLHSYTEL